MRLWRAWKVYVAVTLPCLILGGYCFWCLYGFCWRCRTSKTRWLFAWVQPRVRGFHGSVPSPKVVKVDLVDLSLCHATLILLGGICKLGVVLLVGGFFDNLANIWLQLVFSLVVSLQCFRNLCPELLVSGAYQASSVCFHQVVWWNFAVDRVILDLENTFVANLACLFEIYLARDCLDFYFFIGDVFWFLLGTLGWAFSFGGRYNAWRGLIW